MLPSHVEEILLSVVPAPAARPTRVLFVSQDKDGWWWAWSEPVLYLGLVERRYYERPVTHLPRDPHERRQFENDRERCLVPIAYDPDGSGDFTTVWTSSYDEDPACLIADDVTWEEMIDRTIRQQIRLEDHRERLAAQQKAPRP